MENIMSVYCEMCFHEIYNQLGRVFFHIIIIGIPKLRNVTYGSGNFLSIWR